MSLVYTDFLNGDSGLEIRTKLNAFNNSVVAQVNTNTSSLTVPKTSLVAEGSAPSVKLEVEDGGVAGAIQVYDMAHPTHLVFGMEWLKSNQEAIWSLHDKDSGVVKAMLEMKPDGTFWMGDGMTQHQIATVDAVQIIAEANYFEIKSSSGANLDTMVTTGRYLVDGNANTPPHAQTGVLTVSKIDGTSDLVQIVEDTTSYETYERMYNGAIWSDWKEGGVTHAVGLLTHMIIGKASKTSLPTIYSGDTAPLDSLGKDLDWYHHFEPGSTVENVLYTSTCRDSYQSNLFALASLYGGDASQNDIIVIEVSPHNNMIYIDLKNSTTLPVEELTLEVTNHGDAPVDIPLIVHSNAAGEFMGTYLSSYNPAIEKIVGYNGANPSSFRLKVKEGVQTDKEYDYQKHNGVWFRTDFLNTEQVNALIREYSVTISMDTNINKPTEAECITAFEQLPHADYTKDDSYYIMSTNKGKLNFVKYFHNGATDAVTHTVGLFFVQELSPAT